MVVYIVEAGHHYENSEIMGVYANRKEAEKEKTSLEESRLYDWVGLIGYKVIGA